MIRTSQEEIIKEYWEEVKHKYPQLDYEHFRIICRSPFEFVKILIAGKEFVRILIMYMGKFTVFPGTITNYLKKNLRYRHIGYIDQQEYLRKVKFYSEILEKVKYETLDDDDESSEESGLD